MDYVSIIDSCSHEGTCLCRSTDSFVIYKPVDVLCSTVDDALNYPNQDNEERIKRTTVYDVAASCNFPTNYPLVGRLDYETSGIMLFTRNHELFLEINTPITINNNVIPGMSDEDTHQLYQYKMKHYEVKLLAGSKLVAKIKAGYVLEVNELERELAQPFVFHRKSIKYEVKEFHKVRVVKVYQDDAFSKGRSELGWCIDVEVTILEGKHHQIRRMASRNNFIVITLHRKKIAGILQIDERMPIPGSGRWLLVQEELAILKNIKELREFLSNNDAPVTTTLL